MPWLLTKSGLFGLVFRLALFGLRCMSGRAGVARCLVWPLSVRAGLGLRVGAGWVGVHGPRRGTTLSESTIHPLVSVLGRESHLGVLPVDLSVFARSGARVNPSFGCDGVRTKAFPCLRDWGSEKWRGLKNRGVNYSYAQAVGH